MKTNRRWLKSILAAGRSPVPGLPWQASVRNHVPAPLPMPAPAMMRVPAYAYAARPQANAAR